MISTMEITTVMAWSLRISARNMSPMEFTGMSTVDFSLMHRHISTAVKAKKTATINANHLNPILSFPFPRRYTACMVITVTSALPMPAHVLPRVERPSRSLLSLAKAGIMDQ